MTQAIDTDLSEFYRSVQHAGKLLTVGHAQRWSRAVFNTLGLHLDRKTKKDLAQALHFRNDQLSQNEFLDQISRRSGNTDTDFARYPTTAVLAEAKRMIDPALSERVAQTLSPEVRQLWQKA